MFLFREILQTESGEVTAKFAKEDDVLTGKMLSVNHSRNAFEQSAFYLFEYQSNFLSTSPPYLFMFSFLPSPFCLAIYLSPVTITNYNYHLF